MSFIFPIKIKKGFLIIWESTFHFKASYIFSINSYDDSELQPIYNFIAGPLMNKRLTLINSKSIQKNINFKKRISHKGFDYWLLTIEEYLNASL